MWSCIYRTWRESLLSFPRTTTMHSLWRKNIWGLYPSNLQQQICLKGEVNWSVLTDLPLPKCFCCLTTSWSLDLNPGAWVLTRGTISLTGSAHKNGSRWINTSMHGSIPNVMKRNWWRMLAFESCINGSNFLAILGSTSNAFAHLASRHVSLYVNCLYR